MRERSLRIGIDARYLSHNLVGGVHTYVERLLPAMFAAAPDDTFILYIDEKAPFELSPPPPVAVRTLPWRGAASSVWSDWVRLPRQMAKDRLDVAFYPANHGFAPRGVACVITLHDALNLRPLSETLRSRDHTATIRTRAMTLYLKGVTTRSAAAATRLVTMSGYSRETIAAASGRAPADIDVVHHGAPPKVTVSAADIEAAVIGHGIRRPYVLADGLKNPGVVVRAAERLASAGVVCSFVFFARHPQVLPELAAAVDRGAVRLLIRPSTETLAALYAGAAAFAFPSWVEGFGIPLLEAMQYGAPIVASTRGSIPEVAGDAAALVDADDDEGLADALRRIVTDPSTAGRLKAAGAARVKEFTWQRSAQLTLAAIRQAADAAARLRS